MSKILDENVVGELVIVFGREFPELLAEYLTDVTKKADLMKDKIREDDWEAVRKIAHEVKGSSLNMGATLLANTFLKIENDSALKDKNILLDDHGDIFRHISSVKIAYRSYLQSS